ncbi:protein rapunzel [Stigmatopora nigra]
MSDHVMGNNRSKLKSGVIQALKLGACISSAAAMVNPIFGVAGALLRVVVNHVDDEDICRLRQEFGSINRSLDDIKRENERVLSAIQKETVVNQYSKLQENLKNQFRKYVELLEAPPEHLQGKKEDFVASYRSDGGDTNLFSLYRGVVAHANVFSHPILEVYRTHSGGDRPSMERLCTQLTYMFWIGLVALLGFSALIEDDVEQISEDWSQNMQQVKEKMEQVLAECKEKP